MAGIPIPESFARPGDDRDVVAAWERLLRGGDVAAAPVRGVIARSWLRCRDGAVDPGLRRARRALEQGELDVHRARHRTLVEASAPVMASAREFLSDSGSILLLADAGGLVIGVEGDPATLERAREIQLVPGVSWDELATGTNAIGTALAVGQAVQVHAAEHFCEGIQRWTCSAAVVRDPCDGGVIGAVDVSGASQSYSRQSLAFVASAAAQIEGHLKQLELAQRYRILERCVSPLSSAHSEGVVLFDRRGFAIKANGQAAAALAARGKALAGGQALRVEALNLEAPGEPARLPVWLEAARIEPVMDGGERIGTLVALVQERAPRPAPARATRAAPAPRPTEPDPFAGIVGTSAALREAIARARRLAPARAPVLLLGETGVGKELFARGIHRCGAAEAPLVAVNCAGLSRDLLASALFGYGDGAFTGARRGGMQGKLEAAAGGTLFLDEIGEMPLELQGYLLRALEDGEVTRIGETRARRVDFRLVSATNRDLRGEVAAGRFRMDLFYRVAVTSVRIAPLRDRREDVVPLAEHFLGTFAEERGGARGLSPAAAAVLEAYAWPGNVRELRNVIESIGLVSGAEEVAVDDLPEEIRGCASAAPLFTEGERRASGARLRDVEADAIRQAVAAEHGNLTRAARRLGIAKSTLYCKIAAHELADELSGARERKAPGGR
ncbi:sigma-54-dependent Fis family transcriptional regulator [Anaeromyxobacter oryzae]|uniref:Sigma-54-dependent Fis family transcriptional regulator n=1 Tax=Anaeromyxobacter oryzae TaxID=2918170 RepID=A0ABN6MVM4_9BACT|nr:sigma 54-interacting transcriptional regulator [Anaeromyxobacter oryzae]BDG04970.1 sigma-54-dependent Fis family transcriptional regulator [Anaeromyxobacter oryzae]